MTLSGVNENKHNLEDFKKKKLQMQQKKGKGEKNKPNNQLLAKVGVTQKNGEKDFPVAPVNSPSAFWKSNSSISEFKI